MENSGKEELVDSFINIKKLYKKDKDAIYNLLVSVGLDPSEIYFGKYHDPCNKYATIGTIDSRITSLTINRMGLQVIPENIGDLTELMFLDLNYNPITMFPDSIQKLKKLEQFEIEGTLIKELPEGLLNLPKLNYLNAQNISLNDKSHEIIEKLRAKNIRTFGW